jgi:hypothetical protein
MIDNYQLQITGLAAEVTTKADGAFSFSISAESDGY